MLKHWLLVGVIAGLVAYAAIDGPRIATNIAYAVTKGENQAGANNWPRWPKTIRFRLCSRRWPRF